MARMVAPGAGISGWYSGLSPGPHCSAAELTIAGPAALLTSGLPSEGRSPGREVRKILQYPPGGRADHNPASATSRAASM